MKQFKMLNFEFHHPLILLVERIWNYNDYRNCKAYVMTVSLKQCSKQMLSAKFYHFFKRLCIWHCLKILWAVHILDLPDTIWYILETPGTLWVLYCSLVMPWRQYFTHEPLILEVSVEQVDLRSIKNLLGSAHPRSPWHHLVYPGDPW